MTAGDPTRTPADDSALARAIDEYLALTAGGRRPDRPAFLARHPGVDGLADALDGLDFVRSAAPHLSGGSGSDGPATADDPVGGVLGDYRVGREVGRGGMGVVYEAEQISLRRRVALKVLPFAAVMDPRSLQRFRHEALAAAGLDHPHVVKVYAVGCERGVHFIALQYVDGRPLSDLIRERRGEPAGRAGQTVPPTLTAAADATASYAPGRAVPASTDRGRTPATPRGDAAYYRRVAGWGADAADALEHAHALGVVHRDVKPGNLLVDGAGAVYVADFGLAKLAADPGVTGTGDLLGTVRYMSPEQAAAKHDLVDHRSDVYSLGVTLYELLALTPAFAGADRQAVLTAVLTSDPAAPRTHDRGVPRDLETVVLKAMDKEPARRYQSAGELAADLQRFLASEPVRAKPLTLADRAGKWARRHRSLVGTGVVALAVVAAVSTAAAAVVWRENGAKERALQERGDALAEKSQALADKGEALVAAQRRLALTRRAADEMYVEVAEEWLAQQPRLQPKQREMLVKARGFYEELARESGDDPADRLNAALASFRLALIEAKLGAADRADAAHRQAVDALDRLAADLPDRVEHWDALTRALYGQFEHYLNTNRAAQADEVLARYSGVTARMRERFTADPRTRKRLLCGSAMRTLYFQNTGRPGDAVAAAEEGLEGFPESGDGELSEDEVLWATAMLATLASSLDDQKKYPRAEAAFARSLRLLDRGLRTGAKWKLSFRRLHAQTLGNLGICLTSQGKDGVPPLERAAEGFESLAREFPNVLHHRAEYASALVNLGVALPPTPSTDGKPGRAGMWRRAVGELERCVADFPQHLGLRQELAEALGGLGELLWDRDGREAKELLLRRVKVWDRTAADFPAVKSSAERTAARLNLATRLLSAESPDAPAVAEARELADQATEIDPKSADAWWVLGWACGAGRHWTASIAALDVYARLATRAGGQPRVEAQLWYAMALAHTGKAEAGGKLYWNAAERMNRHPQEAASRRLRNETADALGILAPPPRPDK